MSGRRDEKGTAMSTGEAFADDLRGEAEVRKATRAAQVGRVAV